MAETFEKAFPERFINCFIAEQNMISVALGCSKRNRIPFCSTFATFFTRCFDQIRMAAISFSNVKFFGSHSGTSIGQDGPSQMGLEDLSIFRAIPNIVVLYPSDIVSAEKSIELAANHIGMVYVKGERNQRAIIYDNNEKFEIGKSKVLKSSEKDCLTIVSGGIVLHEGKNKII
jgi:transketolase